MWFYKEKKKKSNVTGYYKPQNGWTQLEYIKYLELVLDQEYIQFPKIKRLSFKQGVAYFLCTGGHGQVGGWGAHTVCEGLSWGQFLLASCMPVLKQNFHSYDCKALSPSFHSLP